MHYLITSTDWMRIALLYSHLLLCAFAITTVLKTDIKIILGKYSASSLGKTVATVSYILFALWITGLAITYIDTGFSPEILVTKPKLLLKLVCVVTLTLNGWVLHHLSFPLMMRNDERLTIRQCTLLVTTGALSTSHWMLAAFIGMSRPLARLPHETLIAAYGLFLICVLFASVFFIPLLYRNPPGLNIKLRKHRNQRLPYTLAEHQNCQQQSVVIGQR